MNTRREEGFTLVEILTVIVIIGILTGMLFPALMSARVRARVSATRADMAAIESACTAFKVDMGIYPPDQHCNTKGVTAAQNILGAIRPESGYQVFEDDKDVPRHPFNGSTKGLVHLLGSYFEIVEKDFGPYIIWKKSRLIGRRPWDSSSANFAGSYDVAGRKAGVSIRGVLPPVSGVYPVALLTDWFGNCYVYDSHPDYPFSRRFLPKPHNPSSYDLYSFGPNYRREGSEQSARMVDEDGNDPGNNEDDINNWADVIKTRR